MSNYKRTEVEEVIFKRRSTRAYKKKQVPEVMIRRILEAGRFAPSAGNCQPWRFIVIQKQSMIDDMENRIKKILSPMKIFDGKGGVVQNLVVGSLALLSKNVADLRPLGAAREVLAGRLKPFLGAPTVILVLKDKRGIGNPDFDTGLASENIVLSAHSMGLATCYIGLIEALKIDFAWQKQMKIESPWEIVTSICVGYPKFNSEGETQRDKPQIDYYDNEHKDVRILY